MVITCDILQILSCSFVAPSGGSILLNSPSLSLGVGTNSVLWAFNLQHKYCVKRNAEIRSKRTCFFSCHRLNYTKIQVKKFTISSDLGFVTF